MIAEVSIKYIQYFFSKPQLTIRTGSSILVSSYIKYIINCNNDVPLTMRTGSSYSCFSIHKIYTFLTKKEPLTVKTLSQGQPILITLYKTIYKTSASHLQSWQGHAVLTSVRFLLTKRSNLQWGRNQPILVSLYIKYILFLLAKMCHLQWGLGHHIPVSSSKKEQPTVRSRSTRSSFCVYKTDCRHLIFFFDTNSCQNPVSASCSCSDLHQSLS